MADHPRSCKKWLNLLPWKAAKKSQKLEEFIAEFQNVFTAKSGDYGRTELTIASTVAPQSLSLAKLTKVSEMLKGMKENAIKSRAVLGCCPLCSSGRTR
jgi:hypothetical protein